MEFMYRVPIDRPLMNIGKNYNYWKVLGFVDLWGLVVLIQVNPFYLIYLTLIIMILLTLLLFLV